MPLKRQPARNGRQPGLVGFVPAMEHGHRNRWLTHWTWWFSSSQTVNVYQRLCVSTHWKVDNQNCHLLYPGPQLRRQLVPILCFLSTSMSYLSVKISREDLEETMVIAPEFFGCPWILPSSNSGIFYNYHIGCGCTLVLCYHRLVSTGWFKRDSIDSDTSYLTKS